MLVKDFFMKAIWPKRKCLKCGKKIKILKDELLCEEESLIMKSIGYRFIYKYRCPYCNEYNYISRSQIPEYVKTEKERIFDEILFMKIEEEIAKK